MALKLHFESSGMRHRIGSEDRADPALIANQGTMTGMQKSLMIRGTYYCSFLLDGGCCHVCCGYGWVGMYDFGVYFHSGILAEWKGGNNLTPACLQPLFRIR